MDVGAGRDAARVARTPPRGARSSRCRSARSSTAWWPADADGEPLRPALIWRTGGRARSARGRGAGRRRRGCASSPGCNLDPGPRRARRSPGWRRTSRTRSTRPRVFAAARRRGWPGRRPASWRSTPPTRSSTGAARPAHARVVRRGVRRRSASTPARLAAAWRAPTPCSGRSRRGCARRPGSSAATLVVLGAGDEMAATLGAGVRRAGRGVRRHGHRRAGVRGRRRAGARRLAAWSSCTRTPTRRRWLLENPGWLSGGAYRWFRDELGEPEIGARGGERRRRLRAAERRSPRRRRRAPTASSWLPALAGAMAPEWNAARARRLVRADGRARPRAPGRARCSRATRWRCAT